MRIPKSSAVRALSVVTLGIVLCAAGICVGEVDDAPGAAVIGILLLLVAVGFGLATVWRGAVASQR